MSERQSTLTEACTPVLLYLAAFRRNSSTSSVSVEELRQALRGELARAAQTCARSPRLANLFERARYALVASADQVVLGSTWPQRAGWSMDLLEKQEFGTHEGGRKFFTYVDEVLEDPGDQGPELAELLFTCMGFGFQGELLGENAELERRRRQLFEKAQLVRTQAEVLTPAAYGHNSDRKAPKLPTAGILRLALVCVGALLFAYLAPVASVEFKTNDVIEEIQTEVQRVTGEQSASDER